MHMGLDGPELWDEALREARRAAGYVVDSHSQESPGSVQSLNAMAAAYAVTQAELILTGRPPGPTSTYLELGSWPSTAFSAEFHVVQPDPDCPLCGARGLEGKGGDPFSVSSTSCGLGLVGVLEAVEGGDSKAGSFPLVAGPGI